MPFKSRPVAAMLVAACAFAAACDQAPGPAGDAGDAPVLSEFAFHPHVSAFPHDAEGEDLEVPLVMEVTATDPDDDLEAVTYVVQSPVAGAPPLAQGTLSNTAGTHYEAAATLTIPSGEVGLYTVLIYATDAAGSLSNDVRGMLRIEGVGSPPAIGTVSAPDTVQRPAAGEPPRQVSIIADVSDPDGLANVSAVQFWNVDNPSIRIHMYDAGDLGDEVAGDGRYTRVVEIDAGNLPGINTFAFQATDRSGLVSSIVQATIVVE